jgi:ligand-binding sensor domain-containing protein
VGFACQSGIPQRALACAQVRRNNAGVYRSPLWLLGLPLILRRCWLLGLVGLSACRLGVLDCVGAGGTNFLTRVWQTEDGLPQNSITAILQSRDGYLWLGTYGGLVRFDGVRFKVFDTRNSPGLLNSRITSLFEDAAGTLWLGHETGDLSRFKDGRLDPQPLRAAWSGGKIIGLGTDATGGLWLCNEVGDLARVSDGLVLPAENRNAGHVVGLARSPSGRLWIARDRGVFELLGGRLQRLTWSSGLANRYVQGIGVASDGGLLVAAEGQLDKWRDGKWEAVLDRTPWGVLPVIGLTATRSGTLLAGTADHGLYLVSPDGAVVNLNRAKGLPHDWVRCLREDREGTVWFGAGGAGLVSLRPSEVSTVQAPDLWQGRAVLSVTSSRDGSLWAGTEGAGVYRWQAGEWTRFGSAEGLLHQFVWSVSEDAQGRIWAGTWGGGVYVRDGARFQAPPGLESIRVATTAFLHGGSNEVWIGTGVGLLHYQDGRTNWYGRAQGLVQPDVRAVVKDRDGAVWFGMSGGGLGCLRDGAVRQWRKADGLADDYVQCLHLDRAGALWMGTFSGGLNRLRQGRFANIGTSQGLPGSAIYHIQDDGRGCFWLSSNEGILRVSKEELDRCADGAVAVVHCLNYGKSDGLPTLECSGGLQPAGCQTADGRLWFPTPKGLVALDPQAVRSNSLAPPVVIEELLVDGHAMAGPGGW